MTADANDARTRDASTMGAMTREDAVRALEMDAKDVDALDEKVIKARYRALCLRWHPDKNPDNCDYDKQFNQCKTAGPSRGMNPQYIHLAGP